MRIDEITSTNIIYAFRLTHDPTLEYRYIGLTSRGVKRIEEHFRCARNTKKTSPVYRWMRKHYNHITIEVLEVVPESAMLNLTEMKWIRILRERGHRLLNLTEGGEGTQGLVFTEEHRKNLSANHARRTGPDHHNFGRKFPGRLGPVLSVESREKISASKRGKPLSAEHRAKIAIGCAGKGGRDTTGTKNPRNVLSEEDVLEIRKLSSEGVTQKTLSEKYKVSQTCVWSVVRRRTWKQI